jgi:hypothetical protein
VNLTQARQTVADLVQTAVGPDLPVFAVWPTNVTAPCLVVSLGAATGQPRRRAWETDMHVMAVVAAGDNTAATDTLDILTLTIADALSESLVGPALWARPVQGTYGGNNYLTQELTVTFDIELGG